MQKGNTQRLRLKPVSLSSLRSAWRKPLEANHEIQSNFVRRLVPKDGENPPGIKIAVDVAAWQQRGLPAKTRNRH
jgi:hypothetical protein